MMPLDWGAGMKKSLLGLVAVSALIAGPAVAADVGMPLKAPPPPPVWSWTGFYLNAGAGYGFWNAETALPPPSAFVIGDNTEGGRGWLGTIGGGYDYQLNNFIVVGLLADFNFGDVDGTFSDPSESVSGTLTERHSWAAGGRVGALVTPDLLAYVNGGFTQASFSGIDFSGNVTLSVPAPGVAFSTVAPHTYDGWFVGGGVETTLPVLGPGWFMRSEYRFSDYNSASLNNVVLPAFGGGVVDVQAVHPYVQTITSSLVYKFNNGGAAPTGPSIGSTIAEAFMPAPAASPWNGFSIGAGGGAGFFTADTSSSNPPFFTGLGTEGGRGGFGTVTAGFDYQVTRRIVLGALADFDFGDMSGTWQDEFAFISAPLKQTTSWAAGARAGWLATPQVLTFVDAGFTQARFDQMNVAFDVAPDMGRPFATLAVQTYNGWFLGSGVETALPFLGRGWFGRVEYRYAQYGSASIPEILVPPLSGVNDVVTIRPTEQTFRAELLYRFN